MRHHGGATMMWVWWAVGAVISFIVVVAGVSYANLHPALFVGWGVGMVFAALLMVFKRGT